MAPPAAKRVRRRRCTIASSLLMFASTATTSTWMMTPASSFVAPPLTHGDVRAGLGGSSKANTQALERSNLRRPLSHGDRRANGGRRNRVGGLEMLWSGGRRTRGNEVTVNIERTSMNSRRISGSIVINRPIEDVWLTLTDYNRLAKYVPNLTQSKLKPDESGRIRLWQEGAQKIVGFDFRASVEMFMNEHFGDPENKMAQRKLTFGLLESRMFNEFDGEWRMQFNSRKQHAGARGKEFQYTTKLFYMVHIRPKGPVPVLALEWQISNEVPNNLAALKRAAESVTPEYVQMRRLERAQEFEERTDSGPAMAVSSNGEDAAAKIGAEAFVARGRGGDRYSQPEWDTDETLEAYIAKG